MAPPPASSRFAPRRDCRRSTSSVRGVEGPRSGLASCLASLPAFCHGSGLSAGASQAGAGRRREPCRFAERDF